MVSTVATTIISPTIAQIELYKPLENTNKLRVVIYASVLQRMKEIWERIGKIQDLNNADDKQKQLSELLNNAVTKVYIQQAQTYCDYFSSLAPSATIKFNYLKLNLLAFCELEEVTNKAFSEKIYKSNDFNDLSELKDSIISEVHGYDETVIMINALFNALKISFEIRKALSE